MVNQSHLLDIFYDQIKTDNEVLKIEWMTFSPRIRLFDNTSETEVYPKQFFKLSWIFQQSWKLSKPSCNFFFFTEFWSWWWILTSEKCNAHVNYADTDYLSSYTATLPFQYPSAILTKFINDPVQSYTMNPYPHWYSQQKTSPQKIIHSMFPQYSSEKRNNFKN